MVRASSLHHKRPLLSVTKQIDDFIQSPLDPLQRGFCVEGGAQCGYCTPGMILTAKSLLARNPNPTEQEINEALSGNLCRCTGYTQILASVRKAIELMRSRQPVEIDWP